MLVSPSLKTSDGSGMRRARESICLIRLAGEVGGMDPVTLIVTALAAAAASALRDGPSVAVKDAQQRAAGLKRLGGELILACHKVAQDAADAADRRVVRGGAWDDADRPDNCRAGADETPRCGPGCKRASRRWLFQGRRACRSMTAIRKPIRWVRVASDRGARRRG